MNRFEIPIPIKELKKAKKSIEIAKERYNRILGGLNQYDPKISERSTILCKKCGKRSQIKNVSFSRYFWYETPHGCTGGDCWHQNGYIIKCPKCGEWEHLHKPTDILPNYDIQKLEYRIMLKMLRFAQECDDTYYSNGEYEEQPRSMGFH